MSIRLIPVSLVALSVWCFCETANAAGSASAGRALFLANCAICHSTKADTNAVGPSISKVYERPAGTAKGYAYSQAMSSSHLRWEPDTLMRYLASPQVVVPGNKMSFQGLSDEGERADVVAFLRNWKEAP